MRDLFSTNIYLVVTTFTFTTRTFDWYVGLINATFPATKNFPVELVVFHVLNEFGIN